MMKVKSNKGITIILLIVTIVVLLIITGITINLSMDSVDQTINSQDKSEMLIIQHAIQERYIEYLETNDESLLVGEENGDYYKISSNGKLLENIEYYVDGDDLYYYNENNTKIELKGYGKAIKNQDIESNKIINNNAVTIDYFLVLGITGEGVGNSDFEVNYVTGYVKKVGSSTAPLEGYGKGYEEDENGNTIVTNTSMQINININTVSD